MKRAVTILVAGILMLGLMAPMANANRWTDECRYWMFNGRPGYTTIELKKMASCLAKKYGVSARTTRYVIGRESGWTPSARNPSSGACGLMQHISESAFDGRLHSAMRSRPKLKPVGKPHICRSPRQNVMAGVWLAKHGGWSHWSVM
jgi:soluble lytic murein transglycosylase-like protein